MSATCGALRRSPPLPHPPDAHTLPPPLPRQAPNVKLFNAMAVEDLLVRPSNEGGLMGKRVAGTNQGPNHITLARHAP